MQNRVMAAMIAYFGRDVRRINHALKVHAFAVLISCREVEDIRTQEIIGITALLHDIGIHQAEQKHNSTAGQYQEMEGPPVARNILSELAVPADIIERVCYITGNHHTYSRIDGIDFQIIVEADLLVNFFEDGVKREAIVSLGERVFRTEAGLRLMDGMYLR